MWIEKSRGLRTEPWDRPALQDLGRGEGDKGEPAKEAEKKQQMKQKSERTLWLGRRKGVIYNILCTIICCI